MLHIGRLLLASVAAALLLSSSSHAEHTPFKYRSYGKMAAYLHELADKYPEVIRLSVAQETYKLPYPKELTCVEDDTSGELVPCKHFVVHLTNHSTLPDVNRPEVFISGALHGNERVGPITTVELITLMAKYATSYAKGDRSEPDTENTRKWLYELVNTRSIYLTPMTNAYGYAHDTREELGVDPNRDYNYMRKPKECMTTMTSRVVNELWRDHIFQLAITFHGGTRAVSYEWGSPDHYLRHNSQRSEKSPDHMAQFQIANLLANYAGAFSDGQLYPTGTMNDIVYGVTGGMEDWGYAASWENAFVNGADKPFAPCDPKTFGGYPTDKTVYNNITHRAFNMLIETSNSKEPSESRLGGFEDLYAVELDYFKAQPGFKAGHVTQNVRLALMMIEMVQPYIRWVSASTSVASSDNVDAFRPASLFVASEEELTEMGCGGFAVENAQVASCNSVECAVQRVNGTSAKLQLAWEVLGAFKVDKTHVELSTSKDFKAESEFAAAIDIVAMFMAVGCSCSRWYLNRLCCADRHSLHVDCAIGNDSVRSLAWYASHSMAGHKLTLFTWSILFRSRAFAMEASEEDVENADTLGTSLFVACLDLQAAHGKELFVRAVTTVDQDWATQGSGDEAPSPRIPPQSHVVNARTNPAWSEEWNGHRVQGTLDWYSPVITIKIDDVGTPESVASVAPAVVNITTTADDIAAGTESAQPQTKAPSKMTLSPKLSAKVAGHGSDSSPEDDKDSYFVSEIDDDLLAELDDDESRTEYPKNTPVSSLTPSPVPTTSAAGAKSEMLSVNEQVVKEPSSLRSFGFLVLGSGGLVVLATLAFLYKRVFRSKRKHYMNINSQRPLPQTAVLHGEDDA